MVGTFNAQSLIMEVFGTFMLCFFGGLVVLDNGNLTNVALAHALILFIVIHIGGDVSGGYYNPAVTIGFLVSGDNCFRITISYFLAELLGSVIAGLFLLLKVVDAEGLGYPKPVPGSNLFRIFIYETMATFLLVLSIFYNVKMKKGATMAGLFVGVVVLLSILSIGDVTGGCLNPARSFGPALVDGNFAFYGFWVYLTAPFLGGAIGALYFEYVLKKNLHKIAYRKSLAPTNIFDIQNFDDKTRDSEKAEPLTLNSAE